MLTTNYFRFTLNYPLLMKDRIEAVLETVRPALRMDGGGIELIDWNAGTGTVTVKLQGACRGCPMSQITLKMGVEAALMDALPEVKEVLCAN